jgi:hypothetical protein
MHIYSAVIREAISRMKRIEFQYDGGRRVVEPHCLGVTTAGNAALRGYQISGFSVSGKVPDWHMFVLEKVSGLTILSESFHSARPGYRRGDRGMERIVAEL